jgi:outer membrane protein OmpA-like peptidoglycan-associated protein
MEVEMKRTVIRILAAIVCLSLLLPACATDPVTGEKRPPKAAVGAVVGAAGGAVLGGLVWNSRRAAVIAAGVGALAGGAVGYYMDKQEAALRQRTQGTGVSVERSGNQIVMNMPDNVTFEFGSAALDAKAYKILNEVAGVLNEYPKTYVDVMGHTDSVGSDASNQTLSERRAASVASYLKSKGVLDERINAKGFGKTRPVASNDNPEGRAKNRRVEIVLTPVT